MSRIERINQILAEGPATASEIAAELEISLRLTSAHMADLRRRGKVASRPFYINGAARHTVNLYSLPGMSA